MKYLLFAFTAILLYMASCGSRHDNDDELNVMPPSGEIQSVASDKISHSRVC